MEGEEEREKKKSIHFALDRGASIWTKDGGRIAAEKERKRPRARRKTHNSVIDKKKKLNDIDPLSLRYLYIFFSFRTSVLNVCNQSLGCRKVIGYVLSLPLHRCCGKLAMRKRLNPHYFLSHLPHSKAMQNNYFPY